MRWLVDGYNVIRRDPDLQAREAESLEAGRRALLHLIARARRAGSAVLTAEQFLEALDAPERPPAGDMKDESDDETAREKRGNPRRLSKKARRAQRALGRLRQP
jgi:hypothetical protein